MAHDIHNPHDSFFKRAMADLRVAKGFFESHLPTSLQEQILLESLALEKTHFVDDKLKSQISDMLYSVKINGKKGYLYLLAEHQSREDPLMPLRIMKYLLEVIDYHTKKEGTTEFPIVWPLLFYNGKTAYTGPIKFLDMYPRDHRQLAEDILTSPFQLVDLSTVEDEQMRQHIWSGLMELAMQANLARYREDLESLAKKLSSLFKEIEFEQGGYDFIKEIVWYTTGIGDMKSQNPDEYLKILAQELSEQTRGDMMTLAERFEKRAEERGIEKGIVKGMKRTALKMLSRKMDIQSVSDITDLSIEELRKLQQSSNDSQFDS